jgi:hypothetical protein
MRVWLRALGTFVVITFLGMLMDRLLLTEGIPRFDLLLISNALVGGVAAGIGGRVDIPTTTASGIRFRSHAGDRRNESPHSECAAGDPIQHAEPER